MSQIVPLPFPMQGLDQGTAFDQQKSGTTPVIMNMLATDPVTGRDRGAQRPGLSKYCPTQLSGGASVQCIAHTIGPSNTGVEGLGQLVYSAPSGYAFGLYDGTGTSVLSYGSSSAVYLMSCWDASANLYVALRDSSTSTTVILYRIQVNGTVDWSQQITHGSSAAASPVMGMVIDANYLYVLWNGTSTYASVIYRYNLSDGTRADTGFSCSNSGGQLSGTCIQNTTVNCLAIVGSRMMCVTRSGSEGAATSHTLNIYVDALLFTGSRKASVTVATLTGSNAGDYVRCYAVTSSAVRLYVSTTIFNGATSAYTHNVKRVTNGAAVDQTLTSTASDGAATGIAFDLRATSLIVAIVGANVFGTGKSLGIYNSSLGNTSSQDANSVTSWDRVLCDQDGSLILMRNASGTNIVSLNADLSTINWSVDTTDDQNIASSVNTYNKVSPTIIRDRVSRIVAIAGGTASRVDSVAGTAITTGTNVFSSKPRIYASTFYPNIYFADPLTPLYFKTLTNTIETWTPTAGSLPVDSGSNYCQLIGTWQGRIVLGGLPYEPQNWFMSAIGDPLDWDYAPASPSEGQAVAGNNADAGQLQDTLTAIMPYSNDYLIFGCDHSIWQMTGNPVAGGRLDHITDITGVAWGKAFTRDPFGNLWFMGSRGGLYRFVPNQTMPERVSSDTIDDALTDLDMSRTIIGMAWDDKLQVLLISITPMDIPTTTTHYFYDPRNKGFFPLQFANTNHNPKTIHLYDGDQTNDRAILLGTWNGYVNKLDLTAKSDDGTAIDAYVMYGPLISEDRGKVRINEVRATLASISDPGTLTVHPGSSVEAAQAAGSQWGAVLTSGRNRSVRQRCLANAIYLKLRNSTLAEALVCESLSVGVEKTSGTITRL